jgi:hypothetical protein
MEIVKRENACPICSSTLWLIPTMSYVVAKIVGVTYHREWIWWVAIPTMFLIWGLLNWKIKK